MLNVEAKIVSVAYVNIYAHSPGPWIWISLFPLYVTVHGLSQGLEINYPFMSP